MFDDLDENGLLGGVPQKFVTERPEIDLWLSYYLKAFKRLSTSRQSGMGLGFIPLSEITNYAIAFDEYDLEKFVSIIQAADNEFVTMYNKKVDDK